MSRRLDSVRAPAVLASLVTLSFIIGCDQSSVDTIAVPIEKEEPPRPGLEARSTTELLDLHKRIPRKEFEHRVRILEIVVDREPDNRSAQLRLMEAAELQGVRFAAQNDGRDLSKPYLYQAARAARALLEMDEPLSDQERDFASKTLYNEACTLALDDEPDRAVGSLRDALTLGFRDPMLHHDPELNSLRDRADFRQLLTEFSVPTESDDSVDPRLNHDPSLGVLESPLNESVDTNDP